MNTLPGEAAASHDVYFGVDKDAVANAATATADIYKGRQVIKSARWLLHRNRGHVHRRRTARLSYA